MAFVHLNMDYGVSVLVGPIWFMQVSWATSKFKATLQLLTLFIHYSCGLLMSFLSNQPITRKPHEVETWDMSLSFLQREIPKPFRRSLFLHSTEQDLWKLMAYHHCMPQDEALNDFESKRSAWGFSIVWVIAYEPPGVFWKNWSKASGWECSAKRTGRAFKVSCCWNVCFMLAHECLIIPVTVTGFFQRVMFERQSFGHSPLSAGKPHPVHPLCKRSFHASARCIHSPLSLISGTQDIWGDRQTDMYESVVWWYLCTDCISTSLQLNSYYGSLLGHFLLLVSFTAGTKISHFAQGICSTGKASMYNTIHKCITMFSICSFVNEGRSLNGNLPGSWSWISPPWSFHRSTAPKGWSLIHVRGDSTVLKLNKMKW